MNVFAKFTPILAAEVRESIISNVLATDSTKHFKLVAKVKYRVQGGGFSVTETEHR